MSRIRAFSLTHAALIAPISRRFDVAHVCRDGDEPVVVLRAGHPLGQALVDLDALGIEVAGQGAWQDAATGQTVEALFVQREVGAW